MASSYTYDQIWRFAEVIGYVLDYSQANRYRIYAYTMERIKCTCDYQKGRESMEGHSTRKTRY